MIILYEWRNLIENDDYLVALQALAILQVSCSQNMYQKITYAIGYTLLKYRFVWGNIESVIYYYIYLFDWNL